MSGITLGLDIGPTSIGWAIIDESAGGIVRCGVRIFPEGVNRPKGHEQSKNQDRRQARGMRRTIRRRALRMRRLTRQLMAAGLWPADAQAREPLRGPDPYLLRARALDERLHPHEIGRVLLHLAKRRGFKSNRKSGATESKKKGMLAEMSQLQADIESNGHRTLGEHLASLRADTSTRIRVRHTRRAMIAHEFDEIWKAQSPHHPRVLTDDLADCLRDTILFQREMYWPVSTIGRCELDPSRKRCHRADRAAQRFRLLQEINNLRLLDVDTGEERPPSPEERTALLKYLQTAPRRSFEEIRKKLDLSPSVRFNLEAGERKRLQGMETDALLASAKVFGKHWWTLPESTRDAVVSAIIDPALDDEALLKRAVDEWGLDQEHAAALLKVSLPEGRMAYSREAILRLLPHLERGFRLMTDDATPSAMSEAGYLRPDQRVVNQRDFLPAPPDLPNPIVRAALFEIRRVVNAIIREHGRPDAIHVEFAREAKLSLKQRQERSREMRDREEERDGAAEWLRERSVKPTRESINRVLLWRRQGERCAYTGDHISPEQLLGAEVEVDHILPRERSLDNSFANKVVAFRVANAEKGKQTPYEWLAETDPERYDRVLQNVKRLPYNVYRRFLQKEIQLDEFVERQLRDTTYIARELHRYLRCLGADVVCTRGGATADLRRLWALNTVLRDDGISEKSRDDHRHHAVDAVVVALTTRSRLQRLAGAWTGELEPPWEGFRSDVLDAVTAINVSHRVRRRARGQLHEETYYGPTATPGEFVYRKPVKALDKVSAIHDVRDPAIRRILLRHARERGVDVANPKAKVGKEVWATTPKMPSGVPIRRVRLLKKDQTIRPIRDGSVCVKPGAIHHVCIFELPDGKRDAVFVTLLDAVERKRRGEPVIQRAYPDRRDASFLMSLSNGELVQGRLGRKGAEGVWRLRTSISTEAKLVFVSATDARMDAEVEKHKVTPNTLGARKVTIDPLGRLRYAND